jgi:predicted RNA binding protein YcfA (HicA-like mRNA interferase family)
MKSLSGAELVQILEKEDWRLLRVKGSHPIFGKAGHRARISVPVHGNRSLRRGWLLYLARLAELDPEALD